jgi:hypothetical protein
MIAGTSAGDDLAPERARADGCLDFVFADRLAANVLVHQRFIRVRCCLDHLLAPFFGRCE